MYRRCGDNITQESPSTGNHIDKAESRDKKDGRCAELNERKTIGLLSERIARQDKKYPTPGSEAIRRYASEPATPAAPKAANTKKSPTIISSTVTMARLVSDDIPRVGAAFLPFFRAM